MTKTPDKKTPAEIVAAYFSCGDDAATAAFHDLLKQQTPTVIDDAYIQRLIDEDERNRRESQSGNQRDVSRGHLSLASSPRYPEQT